MISIMIKLPAGFPLPKVGGAFYYRGEVYRLLSSKYIPEVDNEDFGYQAEHNLAKVEEITDTAEGQALVAEIRDASANSRRLEDLKREVRANGTLITLIEGEPVRPPSSNVLFDTFTIYGGGERLIETDTEYWYLVNNGMDGDDWSRNTVRTSGAGAYGWRLAK